MTSNAAYKAQRAAEAGGRLRCDFCGWEPPQVPDARSPDQRHPGWVLLEAHHVMPRRRKGASAVDNLVLLCPNHHAVADRLHSLFERPGDPPPTRDQLFALLKRAGENPRAWLEVFEGEQKPLDITAHLGRSIYDAMGVEPGEEPQPAPANNSRSTPSIPDFMKVTRR